jgi:23S rRNA pseudouridine1911/1915/1917 synthase
MILYEDSLLLVCNKPAGIAAQPDPTGDESLLAMMEAHCKHPLHIVQRLDRPVSGIMLLAKTPQAMAAFARQWQDRTVEKAYLAAVSPAPPQESGHLVHFIKKQGTNNRSIAQTEEIPDSDRAELAYKTIGHTERYHFLHIDLISGRHHQIRAQLAAIGCHIKGDVKYGARRSNADRSIHLHAWKLSFEHPGSGEWMTWEAPVPETDGLWVALKTAAG